MGGISLCLKKPKLKNKPNTPEQLRERESGAESQWVNMSNIKKGKRLNIYNYNFMKKTTKLGKKQTVKKTVKKRLGKKLSSNIARQGYRLVFLSPDDEAGQNELRNSGKVIGQINITTVTVGDKTDEIIFAVRD